MDQLQSALATLRLLRSNVRVVFESLADGVRPECTEEGENAQLHDMQELLNATNGKLRELESTINNLPPLPGPLVLGHSSYLSQEISQERQALYVQLVNSHKWLDKVHDYGNSGNVILHANSLKRSYNSNSTKRRRTNVSHQTVTPQNFDTVIANIERQFSEMSFKVTRPHASNAVVYITLEKVLRAAIIFKGIMIEWVSVKGYDEEFDGDLWAQSKYMVFRKVQDHTHAAMLHFYSPTLPEFAVRFFMVWLNSYNKLFKEPCKKCGNWIVDAYPPTWRDFRTLEPYHEECK